jgi:hypothetical protein
MSRSFVRLSLITLCHLVVACDGTAFMPGTDAGSSDAGTVTRGAILTWDAPTTNADGTSLTDLAGYRAYHRDPNNQVVQADVGAGTTYTFKNLPVGLSKFHITAYDTAGNESVPSTEVSKAFSR